MSGESIDYPALIHEALLGVVREILCHVVEEGLPGDHHFYLTFRTDHPQIVIPAGLKIRHPETMTIVLQHQFWDLSVEEDFFGVTLRFGGTKHHLTIPFEALTGFIDPDAEFGLQLGSTSDDEGGEGLAGGEGEEDRVDEGESDSEKKGEVISIDEFRKNTE